MKIHKIKPTKSSVNKFEPNAIKTHDIELRYLEFQKLEKY